MRMTPGNNQLDAQSLRRLIARRKLADLLFATLGLVLVVGALTVLVVLFGQLVRDGAGRLASTHEVKRDGATPGRRELVGELRRVDSPAGAGWRLARDPASVGEDDAFGTAELPLDLSA